MLHLKFPSPIGAIGKVQLIFWCGERSAHPIVPVIPAFQSFKHSEPVFVNLLWSPGIDFMPAVPVRQPYLSYRPARLHRLAESIPRNRFLGSLNVYKYELWSFRHSSCSGHLAFHSLRSFQVDLIKHRHYLYCEQFAVRCLLIIVY